MRCREIIIGVLLILILMPCKVNATINKPVNVYIFSGNGCSYCESALDFFDSIEEEYGDYFNLINYEVWYNEENSSLMYKVAEHFGDDLSGVPYIVIGDVTFQGYSESYDEDIISAIKSQYKNRNSVDYVAELKKNTTSSDTNNDEITDITSEEENYSIFQSIINFITGIIQSWKLLFF
jgi:thiol-disulfide isomerase/thioredoxin